ncbi:hypothetical protein E2562_008342 [Oryza meyeriana var. granulata]|uniref:DUF3615 domain-containing protein n=1 Tax=Oryza meyeriana var. granulata TaxID=110450 RepID=A0A6G1EHW4_9ORYZ|nr:hypothetical protein E2562_008342 [Oryza meyeriana var. granulata]
MQTPILAGLNTGSPTAWSRGSAATTLARRFQATGQRDFFIIGHGEEFDAVKPLMEACVRFRGQVWFHVNFWARCRKTKRIKCFLAEVHYKPPNGGD